MNAIDKIIETYDIALAKPILASIITRTVHSKTLPIGMMDYLDEFTINWAGMCAIAVVMIIPALILTFIAT